MKVVSGIFRIFAQNLDGGTVEHCTNVSHYVIVTNGKRKNNSMTQDGNN